MRETVKAVLDPRGDLQQLSTPTCAFVTADAFSPGLNFLYGIFGDDCLKLARTAVEVIADTAMKAYLEAEDRWNKPEDKKESSECVKLHFTPPTKMEEVDPGHQPM